MERLHATALQLHFPPYAHNLRRFKSPALMVQSGQGSDKATFVAVLPPFPPIFYLFEGSSLQTPVASPCLHVMRSCQQATNVAGLHNTTEPLYRATEQKQFSLTTAENACKFGPIHPEQNTYDYTGCVRMQSACLHCMNGINNT
jgi:hypothetical protein